MDLRIVPHSGLPVHFQLEEQFKYLIKTGRLAAGTRLPTARQAAACLGLHRNTVLAVYKSLEQQGYVECRRRQGTVVRAHQATWLPHAVTELQSLIAGLFARAAALGLSPAEVAAATFACAAAAEHAGLGALRLVFVECNQADLAYYPEVLRRELQISPVPVLLADLRRRQPAAMARAAQADLVLTTYQHLGEVRALLAGPGTEVFGLAARPTLAVLAELLQLPAGTRVLLVCISRETAEWMAESVRSGGIGHLALRTASTEDRDDLRAQLAATEVAVISRTVRAELEHDLAALRPGARVIPYDNILDTTAIGVLRSVLADLLARKSAGRQPGARP